MGLWARTGVFAAVAALVVALPAASGAHRTSGASPTMDSHGDVSVAASSPQGSTSVSFTASASDPDTPSSQLTIVCIYDGSHGVSFQSGGSNSANLSVGTYSVSCTARDPEGNTSGAISYTLTVQAYVDTAAPLLVFTNYTAVAPTSAGAMVALNPGAIDPPWDPPHITLTCDHDLGNQLFPIGVTTVHCTATDQAGNAASGSFTVTVTGPGATGATTTTTTTTTVTTTTTTVTTTAASTTATQATTTSATTGTSATATTPGTTQAPPPTTTTRAPAAPTIRRHARIVVDATSPIGAVVRFAATVDQAGVSATCAPASGSLFGLGPKVGTNTFTVVCTAAGAEPMSFAITVRGARDQILSLRRKVAAARVSASLRRSLAHELSRADSDVAHGRPTAAQTELASFIRTARAAKRAVWIKPAARVIAVLG